MITGTWTSFGDVDRSQLVRILIAGLTGIVTTSIVYSIWQAIYNVYFHPLSRFPGPKSWAASRFPREKAMVSGRIHYVLKDLHNQYGDVVRTGRDEISFTSAAAFKDIHTRYGPWKTAFPKDPDLYVVPASGHHSILSVKNDADHSRYRRLLSHAFSEKSLQEQAPLIKTYIDLFISRLHSNASKGPQDMVKWFNFTTFDIIGDLSLGESFECLEKQEYHPWIEFLFKAFKTVSILTSFKRFPWFNKVFMWMLPRSLREARTRNMMFTREKVLKRIKEGTGRPDFMTNVLKHNDKETGMSVNEIVSTFGLLILAGSETTATLLSAATYLILKHPEVLDKMVAEVRSTFKTEDEITQVSVNKLTYQIAVLEESLRVHPPAPFGFPRIVPGEKGQFVAGQWVPKGTVVWTSTWVSHTQEANFRDADKFIPERFLGDARFKGDNRGAFQPFSLGPRNCIGTNLAYAEMRLIMARLLWNFDLELDERSRRWQDHMKIFILWEKPALYVKLKPVVR